MIEIEGDGQVKRADCFDFSRFSGFSYVVDLFLIRLSPQVDETHAVVVGYSLARVNL